MTKQLTLLGDSVIDNNPYVHGKDKPVTSHLKEMLPDWSIDKRAIDGSLIDDVINFQTESLNKSAPIVLSAGGNNLLKSSSTNTHISHNGVFCSKIIPRRMS